MRVYLDSPYDWNPLVTRYPMKHHVCVSFLLFFSPAMLTRGLMRPWWRRYNTNIVTSPGTLYITLTERTRTRCAPHSALCVTGLQSTLIHAAGRENLSQPKFAVPKTKPVCLFFFFVLSHVLSVLFSLLNAMWSLSGWEYKPRWLKGLTETTHSPLITFGLQPGQVYRRAT